MMDDEADLSCRLYVDCGLEHEAGLSWILRALGVAENGAVATLGDVDISLNYQKRFDRTPSSPEWLDWPSLVWLEPADKAQATVEAEAWIAQVCAIITTLRNAGAKVVAACDFEDEVVRQTGWNWSETNPNQP